MRKVEDERDKLEKIGAEMLLGRAKQNKTLVRNKALEGYEQFVSLGDIVSSHLNRIHITKRKSYKTAEDSKETFKGAI